MPTPTTHLSQMYPLTFMVVDVTICICIHLAVLCAVHTVSYLTFFLFLLGEYPDRFSSTSVQPFSSLDKMKALKCKPLAQRNSCCI